MTADLAEPLGTIIRYGLVRARMEGRTLTVLSGRRTKAQQVRLRRDNCGTSQFAIYQMPSGACSPITARPGTSPHEKGLAVDMRGDKEFLARLGARYSLVRPVRGEDWHFEWRGSDARGTIGQIATDMARADWPQATQQTVLAGVSPVSGGGWRLPGLPTIPGLPGVGSINDFVTVAQALSSPDWWRRVGIGAAGVALVIWGATQLTGGNLLPLNGLKGLTP